MNTLNSSMFNELKNNLRCSVKGHNTADHALRMTCLRNAEEKNKDKQAVDIVMEYQRQYGDSFEPFIYDDLFIAGSGGQFYPSKWSEYLNSDIGHYCPNFKSLVDSGVDGILKRINEATPVDEIGENTKKVFHDVFMLFISFMKKHINVVKNHIETASPDQKENLLRMVKDIEHICEQKPSTFLQALQLIWFANCYVHLKPYTDTITLGNLDTALIDLYRADIASNRITKEKALEYICHFYLAFETMGRDTQNIVLGGSNELGNNTENELTELFLKAQTLTHLEQPSVSLKIRTDTSSQVWDSAIELLRTGGGMPSFLNDSIIIDSLRKVGFSEAESNTFCNIGCYEATPYGNTFGGTVSGNFVMPKEFAAFFVAEENYSTFDEFYNAWHKYVTEKYKSTYVPSYAKKCLEDVGQHSASPFSGCILDGCIENLRIPEQFGAKNNIFSVLFGGLGTIVDSLLCVKHFVFDTQKYTLDMYRDQVRNNYPDIKFLAEVRAYPSRFGSSDEYSNIIAQKEATFIADLVRNNPFDERVKMLPAMFIFTGDVYTQSIPATPDGRKNGDRYSYGSSASELLPHRDLTKVLMSSSKLPQVLFPIGAPQTVNLMPNLAQSDKGVEVIKNMVQTYHKEGGTHLQINIANPTILRAAQENPEQYTDLLIRISGHTEPFVRLNKQLQDALIERSEKGC